MVKLGEKYIINKKFDGDYFIKHKKFGFELMIALATVNFINYKNSNFSKLWKNNFM